MSSLRVGPTHDTLRLTIQPYPTHVRWGLMRVNHNGRTTRQGILESGSAPYPEGSIDNLTARGLMMFVLAHMSAPRGAVASPGGGHGGEQTLDLDFST